MIMKSELTMIDKYNINNVDSGSPYGTLCWSDHMEKSVSSFRGEKLKVPSRIARMTRDLENSLQEMVKVKKQGLFSLGKEC